MSTVLTSVSEIVRVGGWALRGAGYPFGVAERGIRLLSWAEAVGNEAIRHLRHAQASIEASRSVVRCLQAGDASSGRIVRAPGRHLLEVGGPAIDLATCDARRTSIGQVTMHGTTGIVLLPAMANLLAQRALEGICLYRAEKGDWIPDHLPRDGWLLVRRSSGRPVFYVGGSLEAVAEALSQCMSRRPDVTTGILEAVRHGIGAAVEDNEGTGYLSIVAFTDANPLGQPLHDALQKIPDARLVDFQGRFASALTDGLPIDAQDLNYLYELEMRTWAPTSERSRGQAGYGVF